MKKKNQKPQEQGVHTSADVARYLGALSENFQDRVQAIAEITLGLNKRFDTVDVRFDAIENRLDGHTEMIGKVATDVEIIKNEIVLLNSGIKKKTDYDEFLLLERRVGVLESRSRHS